MIAKRWIVLVLALTAVAACRAREADQRTDTMNPEQALKQRESLPPAFVAELDSGNTSFREKDYKEALRHYEAATKIDDQATSGWFGVYMAQRALGNEQEAEKAMDKVRKLSPGASLVHPTGGDTAQ